jgi:hypothetical protein
MRSENQLLEKQIIATNESFNKALDQYNSNYLRVAFKLKIVFENGKIDKKWELMHKKTKELTVPTYKFIFALLTDGKSVYQITVISVDPVKFSSLTGERFPHSGIVIPL